MDEKADLILKAQQSDPAPSELRKIVETNRIAHEKWLEKSDRQSYQINLNLVKLKLFLPGLVEHSERTGPET